MARQSTAKASESKQSGKEGKMGEQRLLFRGTRPPTVEKKEGRKEGRERKRGKERKEGKKGRKSGAANK